MIMFSTVPRTIEHRAIVQRAFAREFAHPLELIEVKGEPVFVLHIDRPIRKERRIRMRGFIDGAATALEAN